MDCAICSPGEVYWAACVPCAFKEIHQPLTGELELPTARIVCGDLNSSLKVLHNVGHRFWLELAEMSLES